jgi:hypothetical protein
MSAPTFYRYFADINDALAACTVPMRERVDEIAALVSSRAWSRPRAVASALTVIDALASFWHEHRALYRVVDLLADEGHARFIEIKQHTFEPLTAAFADAMARGARRDARVAAGVVVASLVHVTAREAGFEASGIAIEDLRRQLAEQVALMVTRR